MIDPTTGKEVPIKCIHPNCKKFDRCMLKIRLSGCEHYQPVCQCGGIDISQIEKEGNNLDIKLNWLRLKHFKGIRDFILYANGKNTFVYGENGTGKTTQFDAFIWLLFNKDSTDRSAFKVKPQDEHGNDVHNLQTEVEAELLIDGKPLKLRKMLEEKWTQRRGSANKELTGNTISYWWDDVPVKESEYKQRISELVDEGIFRMITNPMYFNTKVSWQDRRKILLQICGDMSDGEVIASDKKLAKLAEILSGKSIEDYKKILAERIKRLEKEKADIPPRIDELMLSLPSQQPDYSAVEAELQQYKDILAGIEKELMDASNIAAEYRKKQQERFILESRIKGVKDRIDAEANAGYKKLTMEKQQLLNEKYGLEQDIARHKAYIEQNNRMIEQNAKTRERLIEEWENLIAELNQARALEFAEPDSNNFICPMCGQYLPDEAKEKKLAEMTENFEKNKASQIQQIEQKIANNKLQGKAIQAERERLSEYIKTSENKIAEAEKRIEEIDIRLSIIGQELAAERIEPDYNADAEYVSLQQQLATLKAELEKPVEDTTSALLLRKREIQEKIDACNKILHNRIIAENTRKRIEELKAEERKIAEQLTELEGHKYLLEQFVITKVNLLEDKINSRFKYVKFKLFEQQLNGGIAECCQALVNTNGMYVPFDDANHAGKVNAGIDCINALCEYYGVRAPIWVDFRESVSQLIPTDSQVINLVKSESDKALRVEVEG